MAVVFTNAQFESFSNRFFYCAPVGSCLLFKEFGFLSQPSTLLSTALFFVHNCLKVPPLHRICDMSIEQGGK